MKKILSVITACIISSAGFAGCVEKNKETAEKEKVYSSPQFEKYFSNTFISTSNNKKYPMRITSPTERISLLRNTENLNIAFIFPIRLIPHGATGEVFTRDFRAVNMRLPAPQSATAAPALRTNL